MAGTDTPGLCDRDRFGRQALSAPDRLGQGGPGPGETRRVTVTADARLLANYDASLPGWRIAAGSVGVGLASSAEDVILHGSADLTARTMKP
uniref:Uncharacterized protein n=1 Tax=Phenylobacterium glaciei TaxID=2803784 RepID=A0A974P535_9CAUL|nr:hypothetical protein JKL49_06100 [Phenylobacterium glaciei]